jgi:hypothetical protein
MTRYYFHIISGGEPVPDEEGMDLPSLLAAQAEAIASARDLALSADRDGFGQESRIVQIVDATGRIIDSVPVQGDGHGVR